MHNCQNQDIVWLNSVENTIGKFTHHAPSKVKPLELIIQGDFIWSYGVQEPKIPIPGIMNEIAANYDFISYTGDRTVNTDLLTMLLNMHDYNHQNGYLLSRSLKLYEYHLLHPSEKAARSIGIVLGRLLGTKQAGCLHHNNLRFLFIRFKCVLAYQKAPG